MPDPGILDGILLSFTRVLALGWLGLTSEARWLLSQISMWYVIMSLMAASAGFRDIIPVMLWHVAKVFMFLWVLVNMHFLTNLFANIVITAGFIMGGSTLTAADFMRPSMIALQGWNTTGPLYTYLENMSSSWWSALTNLVAILTYDLGVLIPMWVCFNLMALHIVIAVIEFQMVSLFAVIMLPWGIFSGTAILAEGALQGIISAGVRLGMLAFVTGVLVPWINVIGRGLAVPEGATIPIWNAISASAAAFLMMLISWHAPRFAASYFGSGPAFTGSTIVTAAAGALVAGRRLFRG